VDGLLCDMRSIKDYRMMGAVLRSSQAASWSDVEGFLIPLSLALEQMAVSRIT